MIEMIAELPALGGYAAPIKAGVLLALATPWLYAVPWVHKDAQKLRLPSTAWLTVVLATGGLGVAIWLLVPYFLLGLGFYVVLAAGGMLAYVFCRNARVDPDHPERKVLTPDHLRSLFKRKSKETFELLTKVTIYAQGDKVIMPPDMTTATREEMRTYNLVQELLYDMLWRRASEADLAPAGQSTRVLYVVDGVGAERPAMPLADTEAVARFLKVHAGMDPAEHRRPQKGWLSVDLGGKRADMEVLTAGTTGGQRIQFRIIQEVVRTRLDELGMPDDVLARIRHFVAAHAGLLLVSGRRGSGVTSTLYSILRDFDAFMYHLVTLEAAPAVELENVTQQPYDDDAKLAKLLPAIVQRGLDVLMVDNCPDAETAGLLLQVAARKPVLLGVQADDSFVALAKWVQICGDPRAAVEPLQAVLYQVLLRKLCPDCKEAYRPDLERLAKLNLSAEKIEVFYRPPAEPQLDKKGEPIICQTCQGSGYRGRTAAFELLELNDEIRQLIAEGAAVGKIRSACRKNKMLYLQEQALRKVIGGETSIQEVIRITQAQQKRK